MFVFVLSPAMAHKISGDLAQCIFNDSYWLLLAQLTSPFLTFKLHISGELAQVFTLVRLMLQGIGIIIDKTF